MTRKDEIQDAMAMLRGQARCGHCDGEPEVIDWGDTGDIHVIVHHGQGCPAAAGVVDEHTALEARVSAALDAGGHR
ncbi:hypothetical protein ACIQWB_37715 [Streptomyces olivaceus]|uniref:hypothetical protein n=1 Tax=Streptomyces olivaceus TaxID=47716 RepID=UPI00382062C9